MVVRGVSGNTVMRPLFSRTESVRALTAAIRPESATGTGRGGGGGAGWLGGRPGGVVPAGGFGAGGFGVAAHAAPAPAPTRPLTRAATARALRSTSFVCVTIFPSLLALR